MDIPLASKTFTWLNNCDGSWSGINRFFVSPDWEAKFPELYQKEVAYILLR